MADVEFELDQDYFNRAGDKVRYVGTSLHASDQHAFLSAGRVYFTGKNGRRGLTDDYLDILGRWDYKPPAGDTLRKELSDIIRKTSELMNKMTETK